MGGVRIVEEEWERLNQQYLLAVKDADILGIPDFLWRFLLKVSALTKSGYYNRGIRGLLTIVERLDDVNFYPPPHISNFPHNFLTTCHIHYDLEFWGLYRLIFDYVQKCSIISCHEDIIDVMRERYAVKVDRFYQIPTEYSWSQMFEYDSHRLQRHYPDYFEQLCEKITVNYPGEVFLVAAGFLGKIYCQIIKSKGGIALDVGSIVDQWLGYDTRTSGKFYNHFKIQYYSQFKKIVNSDSRLPKTPDNTDSFVRGKIFKSNYYCDKNIYVPTDLFSHWKTTDQKQFLITGHP